jgi:hypothetical protein
MVFRNQRRRLICGHIDHITDDSENRMLTKKFVMKSPERFQTIMATSINDTTLFQSSVNRILDSWTVLKVVKLTNDLYFLLCRLYINSHILKRKDNSVIWISIHYIMAHDTRKWFRVVPTLSSPASVFHYYYYCVYMPKAMWAFAITWRPSSVVR